LKAWSLFHDIKVVIFYR